MKKFLPILFLFLPSLVLAGMPDPSDIVSYSRVNEKYIVVRELSDRIEGDSILAALRGYESYEPFDVRQLLTRGEGCVKFPVPCYELMAQGKDGVSHVLKFQPGTDAETGAPVWAVSFAPSFVFDGGVHDNDPIRLVPSDVADILRSHFDAWDAADRPPSSPSSPAAPSTPSSPSRILDSQPPAP